MKKYLIDCRAFINEGSSISVYLYNLLTNILKDDKKDETDNESVEKVNKKNVAVEK